MYVAKTVPVCSKNGTYPVRVQRSVSLRKKYRAPSGAERSRAEPREPSGAERSRAEPNGAERSRTEPSGAGHPVFEWFERGVELGALLFLIVGLRDLLAAMRSVSPTGWFDRKFPWSVDSRARVAARSGRSYGFPIH